MNCNSLHYYRTLVFVAALLFSTHSFSAAAEYTAVEHTGKLLYIPSPRNFTEVTQKYETLNEFFAALVPSDMEMLSGYLSEGDLAEFLLGRDPLLNSYMIVSRGKSAAYSSMNDEIFNALDILLRTEMDKFVQNNPELIKKAEADIDDAMSNFLGEDLGVGLLDTVFLGAQRQSDRVITSTSISKFIDEALNENFLVVNCMNWIRFDSRMVMAIVYRLYEGPDDIEMCRATGDDWVKNFLVEKDAEKIKEF